MNGIMIHPEDPGIFMALKQEPVYFLRAVMPYFEGHLEMQSILRFHKATDLDIAPLKGHHTTSSYIFITIEGLVRLEHFTQTTRFVPDEMRARCYDRWLARYARGKNWLYLQVPRTRPMTFPSVPQGFMLFQN